jgi:hypothetical protein
VQLGGRGLFRWVASSFKNAIHLIPGTKAERQNEERVKRKKKPYNVTLISYYVILYLLLMSTILANI